MKKFQWITELIVFILIVLVVNWLVSIISKSFTGIICGQILNLLLFITIGIYSVYRLDEGQKGYLHVIKHYFKMPFKFSEIFLILFIFFVGQIIYSFLIEIEFIQSLKIDVFRQFKLTSQVYNEHKYVVLTIVFLLVFIGVVAEEFFFRGYLFRVQRKYLGSFTWIVNGLSWSAIHIFSNTNVVAILPMAFLLSYVYQKRSNIRITIGSHLLMNLKAVIYIIIGL